MTPTQQLIADFCQRNKGIWQMEMAERLAALCLVYPIFYPTRSKADKVFGAYKLAKTWIESYLPELPEQKRPWVQMNLVALMLRSSGIYSICKELHYDTGLALIQAQEAQPSTLSTPITCN